LKVDVDNLRGIIKTEEELNLYIERLQVMSTRIDTIQNELGRLGLLSATESDKVGSLLALSKRLEILISEELEGGTLLKERLQNIQRGIDRVRRKHSSLSETLDQCEKSEKLGSEAVEKAVNDCYEVGEELVTLWQDLMGLRQLLHTLPMRLRVTVSPVKVERDISHLQDAHTVLEKRCGQLLALLRNRLALWQRFEHQLELVQQSVQEADFMMELLTVQGTVDYERLRKATERLEVRASLIY
jgi:nesprin-1